MSADEYDLVKKSKLKFKGEKRKKKRKSDRTEVNPADDLKNQDDDESTEDVELHGGWWKVKKYEHIRDDVAIEFLSSCYARAMGNGSIVLGNPHPPGEGPDEEEIFTAICASTNHVAFKSGYGRYLSVDKRKRVVGLAEAIGETELFVPVFEDDNLALCAHNDMFLAFQDSEEPRPITASSSTAGPTEMLTIRINYDPNHRTSKAYKQVS